MVVVALSQVPSEINATLGGHESISLVLNIALRTITETRYRYFDSIRLGPSCEYTDKPYPLAAGIHM